MSNTKIQLKKSGVSGNVPVDLQYGEPALNYDDGKLYYKAADGSIGYISSTHSFNTINVDSTLLFATSNADILSIVPAFGISVSGSGKTITIGDGATSNIAQGAFNHSNTRFSANGGTLYGNIDVLGYANVQNTIVVGTGAYTILPNLIAQFTGNTELYSQVNQQNINANGTADFVVTADNGTDEINYLDMGIAGSTYINSNYNSWHFVNPNDGYLLMQGNASQNFGGNVFFGTTGSGSGGDQIGDIVFVQGSDTDNEVARFVLHEGLVIKTKTASTSNSSGALVVQGGIGANGSIYGDAVYDSNIRILDRANAANSKAQAAFDYANTIGAGSVDQTARNTANAAFDTANTDANNIVIVASYANSAYAEANSANLVAQAAFDYANTLGNGTVDQTARDTANGAFDTANTGANNIIIVASYANSAYTEANSANLTAQSGFDKSNTNATDITITASYANSAYASSNTNADNNTITASYANSAYKAANLAQSYANSAFTKSNTNSDNIVIVASYANSAYTQANTGNTTAQASFDKANTNAVDITIVASYANSAYTQANTGNVTAQAAFDKANTDSTNAIIAGSYANSAYTKANTNAEDIVIVASYANSAYTKSNTNADDIVITASYANSAYTKANSANLTAQAAFDKANTDSDNATIAGSYANSAYTAANLAQSYANSAFTKSNTNATDITIVGSYANSAYTEANTNATDITIVGSYANSSYIAANLAQSYANSAFSKSNTNAADITITASYANSAYTQANTNATDITIVASYANSAYTAANLAQSYSNSAYTKSNTNATDITIVASYANSAYTKSNTNADNVTIVGSYANSAYTAANLAQSYSNSAFTKANTNATDITITASYANSAYTKANTGNTTAQAAFDKSNTNATDITIVASYANSSYTAANLAQSYANSAFTKSNTNATDITIVASYANSAYADANSKTKTYVQDTAPTEANVDDIWIDSSTGIEYTYISSNSASQWIEFGPYGTPLNGTANIQFADQTIFGTKPNQDITLLSSGSGNVNLDAANTYITGNLIANAPGKKAEFNNISSVYFRVNTATTIANSAAINIVASTGYYTQPPTSAGYALQATGSDGQTTRVVIDSASTDGSAYSAFIGRHARGTHQNPTAAQANDLLARFSGNGYGATGYGVNAGGASIDIIATENYTDTARGTKLNILATNPGTNVRTTVASFASNNITLTGNVIANSTVTQTSYFSNIKIDNGIIYPTKVSAANTTQYIDYANGSLQLIGVTGTTTIVHQNITTGRNYLIIAHNNTGADQTINLGVPSLNCTATRDKNGKYNAPANSIPIFAGTSASYQFISFDGDLANVYCVITPT